MKKTVLLQGKFLLVQILNMVYSLLPFFILKKILLQCVGIKIGSKSCIHRSVKFFHIGNLSLGDNSVINFGCYLDNRRSITIGNNVSVSHNVKIYTLGHAIDSPDFRTQGKPVIIKDNACIFANVLIMPGVVIGDGAVILPGSVITKSVGDMEVVGGNPAKFLRKRNSTLEYSIDYSYWYAL